MKFSIHSPCGNKRKPEVILIGYTLIVLCQTLLTTSQEAISSANDSVNDEACFILMCLRVVFDSLRGVQLQHYSNQGHNTNTSII